MTKLDAAARRLVREKIEAGEEVPTKWAVNELLKSQGCSREKARRAIKRVFDIYDPSPPL